MNLGKFPFLSRDLYLHVILHLHSEFRVNRPIRRRDIAKKTIFKIASCHHLEFEKFRFLSNFHPRNGNLHLCTKFDQNRIIHCWDMEIKLFPKWRPSAILDFLKIAALVTCHILACLHLCSKFRIDRPIWRRDIAKNDFEYGVRPPSWICYDVIIWHRKTAFYVPNFVLNFHGVRFVISEISCISCFSILT